MRSPVAALKHDFDIPRAVRVGAEHVGEAAQRRLHVGRAHTEEREVGHRSVAPERREWSVVAGTKLPPRGRSIRLARAIRRLGSAKKTGQEIHGLVHTIALGAEKWVAKCFTTGITLRLRNANNAGETSGFGVDYYERVSDTAQPVSGGPRASVIERALACLGFAAVLAVGAGLGISYFSAPIRNMLSARHWRSASCEIISTGLTQLDHEHDQDNTGPTFRVDVTYRYPSSAIAATTGTGISS